MKVEIEEKLKEFETKLNAISQKNEQIDVHLFGLNGEGGQLKALQASIDHLASVVERIKPNVFSDEQIREILKTIFKYIALICATCIIIWGGHESVEQGRSVIALLLGLP